MQEKKTLYLLDAYGLIYRSYHAFARAPLINDSGANVSAVYGFFRSLHTLLCHYRPRYFVAVFDSLTPTFRHVQYPAYKAKRDKTSAELYAQIPLIEEILCALGITVLRHDGFEADDLIATLAKRVAAEHCHVVIISSDKDVLQLVCDTVQVLRLDIDHKWTCCDAAYVQQRWTVMPTQLLDLFSLMGDSSDNVPGVRGIGPKTAAHLLHCFGTLDGIYRHTYSLKEALRTKIVCGKKDAFFSRSLIELRDDVPCVFSLEDSCCIPLDVTSAARIFVREGLHALAQQYRACVQEIDTEATNDTLQMTESSVLTSGRCANECFLSQVEGRASTPEVNSVLKSELKTSAVSGAIPIENRDLRQDVMLARSAGHYRGVTDPVELKRIIDCACANGVVAFDCETDGLHPHDTRLVGFSICFQEAEAFYVPLIVPDVSLHTESTQYTCARSTNVETEKECTEQHGVSASAVQDPAYVQAVMHQLRRLWNDETLTLVMHNGKFDYHVMHRAGVFEHCACNIFDTMVAAWLLDPDRGTYGMDVLAASFFQIRTITFEEVVAKGQTFAHVPYECAVRYAAEDADITFRLYHYLKLRLETAGLLSVFETIEMPLLPILARMEEVGIFLRKDVVQQLTRSFSDLIQQYEHDIFSLAGHEFNIGSPKQLQTVLFQELHLPPGKKNTQGYSTDHSVLKKLARKHPIAEKILLFRDLSKLRSTYTESLAKLADQTGRVHTSFVQIGTATGRLSSRNPNLQNIPIKSTEGRKIRQAFQATVGHELISADYTQIELVVLAHLSQDRNLLNAFRQHIDIHALTAAYIFNVSIDDVQPAMRRIAKTINFGIVYGMSAFRLSDELKISQKEAQSFIYRYFETYPGVYAFSTQVAEQTRKTGYVTSLAGRRRYIRTIDSRNTLERARAERMALNTQIQSSAADIVKIAMIAIQRAFARRPLRAQLLLQVHDELIFEAPAAETAIVKEILFAEMEHAVELSIPLRIHVESGNSWGDFH